MKKVFADKSICVAILVAISVVNLWVSFMMAAQLYAESRLIPHGVLVVSCFILLETLVALCHYLLQEMSRLLLGNHKDKPTMSGNGSQFGEQETIPDQLDEEDRLDKIYTESNLRCQEEKEEFEKSRNEAIHDYVYSNMASLLDQDEVKLLWQEIKQWIGDPKYTPRGMEKWHWKKEDVSNYDMRHFIWNIAVRMGWNKYNTTICADFTKDLFPDLCGEIEAETLMRNLKAKAREGYIKIDMPDEHNPIKFHNSVTE